MNRSFLIAVVLALAVAGWILSGQVGPFAQDAAAPAAQAAGETPPAAAPPPLPVRVAKLSAMPHQLEVVARGRTEALRRVEVRSELDGRVVEILADKGARVKAGAVLVQLAVDDRAAKLAESQALVRQRQIEYDAAKTLNEKGFRPEMKVAEAVALLDAAKARVKQMEVEMAKLTLRAPFDGVVEQRQAEIGAYVKAGNPVASIADLDPCLVVAQVSEQDVGRIAVGDHGRAHLVTGEDVSGRVRFVAPTADPATRTFRVELEVPNPDGRLRDGITTEMRIATASITAHFVSPSVLTLNDSGEVGVRAVDDQGIVRFHRVKIIDDTPEGIWLTGLPEQVSVITVGQEFVREGQSVTAVPADGATS